MTRQLGIDAAGPTLDRALSQWHTPPAVAQRLAEWLPPHGIDGRPLEVLEPSAGGGALVDAVRIARPAARITALEIDRRWADHLRDRYAGDDGVEVSCDSFLAGEMADAWDAVVMNPPWDRGQDGVFLARAMDAAPLVIALLPASVLEGARRHRAIWSYVERGDWHAQVRHFIRRPRFGGDFGGGMKPVCALRLVRADHPDVNALTTEPAIGWW